MSTAPQRSKHQLRVNSYDKVSSWIVSLLIVTCVTVGALFIVYITSRLISKDFGVPVTPIASGGGGTGGVGGAAGDSEPDSPEEATAFDEPQMQDTLAAVTSAVTTRTAILTDEQIDLTQNNESHGDNRTPGFGGGRGGGVGGGIGSGFGPGRGGPPGPDRAFRFEPSSLKEFAEWLDFFKIEIAVLDQENNKIHYASNLASAKPTVKSVDAAKQQEPRIPVTPTDAQFLALDRELAKKAGIADKGEIIVQLFPMETMAILADLEQKHAGQHKPDTIRGTVFRVTHTGNQFQFSVISQTYRY